MNNDQEKIRQIITLLSRFDDAFFNRPGMLGTPEEVNAMFFHLDQIRFILEGRKDFDEFDKSWIGFLIHKKYIVGAYDHLVEGLKSGRFDFELLKELRKEYFDWREKISRMT